MGHLPPGVAAPGPVVRQTRALQLRDNRPLTSIRGLAALWVLGSHVIVPTPERWHPVLIAILQPGYVGVDIFFVLSGFILAAVYQDLAPGGVTRFFVKRAARLYPLNLAILVVLAFLFATGLVDFGSWASWPTLPWFVLMLEPYSPTPLYSWNVATWSIGIELACYLAFPLVLMAARRLPTAALAVASVALLAGELWVQSRFAGHWWGWRAVLRGFGGFWPGVMLGCLAIRLPTLNRRLAAGGEILSLIGIALAVAFDLRWVPVFAGPLILCLYFDLGPFARALRGRAFFWLGETSFSIYLLHGLIMGQTAKYAWVLAQVMPWTLAVTVWVFLFVAMVLGLSHLTYRFIEQPGRRLPELWRAGWGAARAGTKVQERTRTSF